MHGISRKTYHEKSGYSLVELLIVVTLIGISSGIALFAFKDYDKKGRVEAQIKQMAADISEVRIRALTTKQRHSVTLNQYSYVFKSYSSETWSSSAELLAHGKVIPAGTHSVVYRLKKLDASNNLINYDGTVNDVIEIDERGMVVGAGVTTVFLGSAASTTGGINCLIIHTLRINVGNQTPSGTACNER
jgi:prepilin-type N-terminal cleavage/methylation domain-containing protein